MSRALIAAALMAAAATAPRAEATADAPARGDSVIAARPIATLPAVGAARVGYLAGATAYVEAGRADGLLEGDTLEVMRGGAVVARLRVTFLSSHRAACDTLAAIESVHVGDAVRFRPRPPAQAGNGYGPEAAGDSAAAGSAAPAPVAPARQGTRFHGRAGARFLAVRDAAGGGFRQPAFDLRIDGADLGGAPLQLGADLRGRRTSRTHSGGGMEIDGSTRVYRLSLTLHDRRNRRRVTLGRQSSPALAGVSLFDGALIETGRERWNAGIFSGTQPEPLRLGLSGMIVEHGAYVEVRQRPLAKRRWSVVTGGITSWQSGQPNRDFLFMQAFYGDVRWSASLAEEADVYSGWRRVAGEPGLSLTSTFLTTRLQIAPALVLRAGFDDRRNVRLYRDRLTPETEFDDRYRRGAWVGGAFDLRSRLRLDGDVRSGGGSDRTWAWSSGLELQRLLPLSASLRGRYSRFSGDRTVSRLVSFAVGCSPLAALRLGFSAGSRTSADIVSSAGESVRWESADLDLTLPGRWFVSGSFERDHGGLESVRQGYASLSWRF